MYTYNYPYLSVIYTITNAMTIPVELIKLIHN